MWCSSFPSLTRRKVVCPAAIDLGADEGEVGRVDGDDGNLERGIGARVAKARRREEDRGADEQRERDDFQHGAPRGREGSDNMATPEVRREGRDVAVAARRAMPFCALVASGLCAAFFSSLACVARRSVAGIHCGRRDLIGRPARPANLRTPPSADARAPHAWGYEAGMPAPPPTTQLRSRHVREPVLVDAVRTAPTRGGRHHRRVGPTAFGVSTVAARAVRALVRSQGRERSRRRSVRA